jgi:hypothetical protein
MRSSTNVSLYKIAHCNLLRFQAEPKSNVCRALAINGPPARPAFRTYAPLRVPAMLYPGAGSMSSQGGNPLGLGRTRPPPVRSGPGSGRLVVAGQPCGSRSRSSPR